LGLFCIAIRSYCTYCFSDRELPVDKSSTGKPGEVSKNRIVIKKLRTNCQAKTKCYDKEFYQSCRAKLSKE